MDVVKTRLFSVVLAFASAVVLPHPLAAQPVIAALGVRNGASYAWPGLPNSDIAEGSLFIVFGRNMGPSKLVQVSSYPLPSSQGLAGTSIKVTVKGVAVDAIILYTFATQIAAVMPSKTLAGTGTLTVTYNGQTSAPARINVVRSSFGIFTVSQSGSGQGVLQNVNSATDRPFNSPISSAQPGQVVILWGTGLGPVGGDEAAGPLPGDQPQFDVHVWVGGKQAAIQYRGRSGCCTADDQINFVVPDGVEGCSVPVYTQMDSTLSNFVTMSIGNNGAQCADANGLSAAQIQAAAANGGVRNGALNIDHFDGLTGTTHQVSDQVQANFAKTPVSAINASPLPKAGLCFISQFPENLRATNTYLDAGKVSLGGPGGPYDLPMSSKGSYSLLIASGSQLNPGTYTFGGSGGADVGAFQTSIDTVNTFRWDQSVTTIDRSQTLTVTWTGGSSGGLVAINIMSSVSPGPMGNVGASLICYADSSAGSYTFTVPLLSALPGSFLDANGNVQGKLDVSEIVSGAPFTASGLDLGTINFGVHFTRSLVNIL